MGVFVRKPKKQQQQQQHQDDDDGGSISFTTQSVVVPSPPPSPGGGTSGSCSYEARLEDWPWVWAIRDGRHLDWRLKYDPKNDADMKKLVSVVVRHQDLPVPITKNLYLGNAECVSNLDRLQELGITSVLNMAGPLSLKKIVTRAFKNQGIAYKRMNAKDEKDYPLLENHWEEARDFIAESTKNGGKCVVHCVAGINRSSLIAASYYMLSTQTTVLKTVKHFRKRRGNVALQNEGFQEQLVALARKHNLLDAEPGTLLSSIQQVPPTVKGDWRIRQRRGSSNNNNKNKNKKDSLWEQLAI